MTAPSESVDERRREFRSHVWNHTDDVFQAEFDVRARLSADELDNLAELVRLILKQAFPA